jgi:predicted nucleotidyltransferase component of viral defense system
MTAYASELPDFTDLIRATASAFGIPAPIVEKDYYLTRALFFLSRDHAARFVLKGGTSLTKGWGLLERFSEDLDLLLKVESDGQQISKGERERRLKAMAATIAGAPGFSPVQGRYPVETGVHRTAEFSYPGFVEDLAGLSKTIRLEMGTRGGPNPSARRTVLSMVAQHAARHSLSHLAVDLQAFEVEMLDVKRTFVEKLFTIHAAYEQDRAANKTRHYYDLFRLCGLPEIREFAGTDEYREIFKSVRRYSQENFPDARTPAKDSFSDSPALNPDTDGLSKLKRNYEREKHLFFAQPPTMDEILGAIRLLLPKL